MSSIWVALTVTSAAAVQWTNVLADTASESWVLVAWGAALLAVGRAVRQHQAPSDGPVLAENRW